jgi:hypothetical protein
VDKEIKSMLDNIGKVVYTVGVSRVFYSEIYGVTITSRSKYYVAMDEFYDEEVLYEDNEGKTWFWTREEAEAKLSQKQTNACSSGIKCFYDAELLENAKISNNMIKTLKYDPESGKTVEFRAFDPLPKSGEGRSDT